MVLLRHALRAAPRHVTSRGTLLAARRAYHFERPLLDELHARGLVAQVTAPDALASALAAERQVAYAGVDPTARMLHAGHLLPLLVLLHLQLRGHRVLALVGGATGLVGDPSGRATERAQAAPGGVQENAVYLKKALAKFFKSGREYAAMRLRADKKTIHEEQVIDNASWTRDIKLIDFLRDVGVHARMSTMLGRESVQSRLSAPTGMSFAEFTYQLLQGHDFAHLHATVACSLQVGGSDQWGNMLAGLDLIARRSAAAAAAPVPPTSAPGASPAFALTTPLLTSASGEKFGKSAGNAVWLDAHATAPFEWYQFWARTPDADVERYLKMFTLLPLHEIAEGVARHESAPEKRIAQRVLADELTLLVHGEQGLANAHTLTRLFFHSDLSALTAAGVLAALRHDPRLVRLPRTQLLELPVVRLAREHALVGSGGDARRLVDQGGLYANNARITNASYVIEEGQLVDGRIAVLRAGKDKHIVLVMDED